MKYGHFDDTAREYVIDRPDTPRSWSNYLGSTEYGAIITNNAGGYSFYKSAGQGRFLRLRFNTIPMDQPGRYFYLRDDEDGDFWSASWQPVGKPLSAYRSVCRHGTAYTVIESTYADIETESTYFVPLGQNFEYWRLRVTNRSERLRKLSLFTYCEFANTWNNSQDLINLQYNQYITRAAWVNGILQLSISEHLPSDPVNFQNNDQGRWSWMAMTGADLAGFDTDREEFLGGYRSYDKPIAVERGRCSGSLAYGDNACGTLHAKLAIAPGESREILILLGVGKAETGTKAVAEYGCIKRADEELSKLKAYWHAQLQSLSAETPDADFNHMINVWNPYNSLITFAWSRAASLVYNGERDGLGYRDTVQDILGVLPLIPEAARERLELMLTGQLANGGAMPVVKPFSHRPGHESPPPEKNYRSDDCLWLFNTVPSYVAETGDVAFYRKRLPYADEGEATVLGHLRRALEFNLERSGAHGLPCGLEADWNDCLKLGYFGESLFVAFQLRMGLGIYADICDRLGEPEEAQWARERRGKLDQHIHTCGWDGKWFIWAIGEDGTVYGTHRSPEGSIYLNTQVWSVISGAATTAQGRMAMDSVREKLATEYGVMLCAPPFVETPVTVMRAVLYNPGTKENSGIFNHTQGWAVMAECLLGNGDQAYAYHRASMPSAYNDRAEIRESEPYVCAQSTHALYSRKSGASRLSWLSGAASWAYHSATHYILGIRPEIDGLRIDPCIPHSWPGFTVRRLFRGMRLDISVRNPGGVCRGVARIMIDGEAAEPGVIPIARLRDGAKIDVELGATAALL